MAVLDKLNTNQSFADLPSEAQHFFTMQIIKFNITNTNNSNSILKGDFFKLNEIKIKPNQTELLCSKNIINTPNFICFFLHEFENILIEIAFPLNLFDSIFKNVACLKEKVCNNISGVRSIKYEFEPNGVINWVNIEP